MIKDPEIIKKFNKLLQEIAFSCWVSSNFLDSIFEDFDVNSDKDVDINV